MNIPWYYWLLILVVLLAFASLISILVYTLSRIREIGQSIRNTSVEVSEGLKVSQIEVLKQAQLQMDRITERLQGMQGTLDERLKNQQVLLSEQLTSSGQTMADLKKELGALSEATGQMYELGKDIASLEDILGSPKLRGGVGEIFLEKLLADIFPPSFYSIQHTFSNGVTVDAVIRIGNQMVPIDSKFPIEDFRRVLEADETERSGARRKFVRNVQKKIDEISAKYILPDEGTYDFALMYIPAENVYYETILRDETAGESGEMTGLLEYSVTRRVIPVSPNSFYAYLQVILYGLKGMELEKRGGEILSHLRRLHGELDKFMEEYAILGTHLDNAEKAYDRADRKLTGLSTKLRSMENTSEPPSIEST